MATGARGQVVRQYWDTEMDNFEEKKVNYEKRIFVFIDILGFSNLVKESEVDNSKILRIYKILERTKSMANLPIGYKFHTLNIDLTKFQHHAFSDTITMSCPYESFHYFSAIIGWVEGFQYSMLIEESTFIRGAIVYGSLIDDASKSVIFGPALVSAYKLIALRKSSKALQATGDLIPLFEEENSQQFAFMRRHRKERFVIVLNPSIQPSEILIKGIETSNRSLKIGSGVKAAGKGNDTLFRMAGVSFGVFEI